MRETARNEGRKEGKEEVVLSAVPSCDSLRRAVILNMAAPLPELFVSLVSNSFQPASSEF